MGVFRADIAWHQADREAKILERKIAPLRREFKAIDPACDEAMMRTGLNYLLMGGAAFFAALAHSSADLIVGGTLGAFVGAQLTPSGRTAWKLGLRTSRLAKQIAPLQTERDKWLATPRAVVPTEEPFLERSVKLGSDPFGFGLHQYSVAYSIAGGLALAGGAFAGLTTGSVDLVQLGFAMGSLAGSILGMRSFIKIESTDPRAPLHYGYKLRSKITPTMEQGLDDQQKLHTLALGPEAPEVAWLLKKNLGRMGQKMAPA